MARPEVKVYKVATELLGDYDMGSLSQRIELQKAFYLFQRYVANLNYHFNWYIYGPYSPSLTRALVSIEDEKDTIAEEAAVLNLKEQARTRISRLKQAMEQAPTGLKRVQWLELLASVSFLQKHQLKSTPEKIHTQLRKEKPDFTTDQIDQAFEVLSTLAN